MSTYIICLKSKPMLLKPVYQFRYQANFIKNLHKTRFVIIFEKKCVLAC